MSVISVTKASRNTKNLTSLITYDMKVFSKILLGNEFLDISIRHDISLDYKMQQR